MSYSWSKTFNAEMRGVSLNEQPAADVVGKVLDGIERKQGEITPELFVAASTKRTAKTHGMFEWDDTVAGERYRLEQARLAIRSIEVTVQLPDDGPKNVRAYSSVAKDTGGRVYINTVDAMSDREQQDALLQDYLNALIAFRRRWSDMAKLAKTTTELDSVVSKAREAVAAE